MGGREGVPENVVPRPLGFIISLGEQDELVAVTRVIHMIRNEDGFPQVGATGALPEQDQGPVSGAESFYHSRSCHGNSSLACAHDTQPPQVNLIDREGRVRHYKTAAVVMGDE